MADFFESKIEYLKGVGPQKATLLQKELEIFTFKDLLFHFPFRYEDRTQFHHIKDFHHEMSAAQIIGKILRIEVIGIGPKKRLVAHFSDGQNSVELVWFKGVTWLQKTLMTGLEYVVYGKPHFFNHQWSMAHPEIEIFTPAKTQHTHLFPIYSSSEKLKNFGLDSKGLYKLIAQLMLEAEKHIQENLPVPLLKSAHLLDRAKAFVQIHHPENEAWLEKARYRLKFEELFYNQLKILYLSQNNRTVHKGLILKSTQKVHDFYHQHLPFSLTNAQKRVLKDVHVDLQSGRQMNRLIQGDVGSGKTMVAFIAFLMAASNGVQACLMAPTEILAQQHIQSLLPFCEAVGLRLAKLSGITKKSERDLILKDLSEGTIDLMVGTHALLEDRVQFKQLGLVIVDEQHKFGVAQRARLWAKNKEVYPHILVMTATPIPRTLAMTLYGDLDVSVIDELPAGRKPVKTVHRYDSHRSSVFGFMREEISKGRQVYMVYPLIEESEKADLKDLMNGFEAISRAFPLPEYAISIVYGKQKPKDKQYEMQRFVRGETQIMVSTTVIEVGVNVPNASVMIIENAERFGLAQLHQLRGRVGRGAEQSYCVLMTKNQLSSDGRERIGTMVATSDGFQIAEVDLKLRGPGDMAGTQQSGVLDFHLVNLAQDGDILQAARKEVVQILEKDPKLLQEEHMLVNKNLQNMMKHATQWAMIS